MQSQQKAYELLSPVTVIKLDGIHGETGTITQLPAGAHVETHGLSMITSDNPMLEISCLGTYCAVFLNDLEVCGRELADAGFSPL